MIHNTCLCKKANKKTKTKTKQKQKQTKKQTKKQTNKKANKQKNEWFSGFAEHVVFMTGGIRNGLAAVCVWIFNDWVESVQNHGGRSGTTTW